MVRRNVDISKGLVNGAMGTVTAIGTFRNSVQFVDVLLDSSGRVERVESVCANFEISIGIFIRTKQGALTLVYAITIHKKSARFDTRLRCHHAGS